MTKKERNDFALASDTYKADFIRIAKMHLPRYTESVTEATPRFGSNAFVCPCCGSGSGKNKQYTPAFFLFQATDGAPLFKCHSCGESGDIFKLAGIVNHTEHFPDQMKIVADFLGVDPSKRTPLSNIPPADAEVKAAPALGQKATLRLKQQAMTYITNCRKHISETDYFHRRGLTDETIKRFGLGYDSEKQMAIIPFTSAYYIGRSTTIEADRRGTSKHFKPTGLRQPIFNLTALSKSRIPVFITEAPLDAISIMQAGGMAMALGGGAVSVLKTVLDVYHPENPFILAFDQDEPGRQLESRVATLLKERDIPYSCVEHPVFTQHKDANAALLAKPTDFQEAVAAETNRARRIAREQKHTQESLTPEQEENAFADSASEAAKQVIRSMKRPEHSL